MVIIKNIGSLTVDKIIKISLLTFSLLIFPLCLNAQVFFKVSREFDLEWQQKYYNCYNSVKPVLPLQYGGGLSSCNDTVIQQYRGFKKAAVWSKEHFFEKDFLYFCKNDTITKQKISLCVNPIFVFESRNLKDESPHKNYSKNTRGFEVFGQISDRIAYYTAFYENQGYFPDYVLQYINTYGVIPGQGVGKEYKTDGLDWAWATGNVYVKASENLEFVLGYGKNFIGSGYRSIVLSDESFNYPYLRAQYKLKNFYYNVVWAQMQSRGFGFEPYENHRYRYASYHTIGYLSNFCHGFNVSLIEGVMWRNTKDGAYTTKPRMLMFWPVAGLPTLFNGFDGKDNIFWAADIGFCPLKHVKIYGQARFDGSDGYSEDGRHFGGQVGVHFFDILGFWVNNDRICWHVQAELTCNDVKKPNPKVDDVLFGHYAEPLQYSGTTERVVLSEITFLKRFEGEFKYLDGCDRKLCGIKCSLVANPTTRWKIYVGMLSRTPNGMETSKYVYFGTCICPINFYDKDL